MLSILVVLTLRLIKLIGQNSSNAFSMSLPRWGADSVPFTKDICHEPTTI
jgi:hypothetical protein